MPESFLEMFFSVKGRLNRKRFLLRSISLMLVMFVFNISILFNQYSTHEHPNFLLVILGLITTFVGTPLAIRRLHDLNCSGWWVIGEYIRQSTHSYFPIVSLIAGIYGLILGIYLMCFKGTVGLNQYGEDRLKSNTADTSLKA